MDSQSGASRPHARSGAGKVSDWAVSDVSGALGSLREAPEGRFGPIREKSIFSISDRSFGLSDFRTKFCPQSPIRRIRLSGHLGCSSTLKFGYLGD